MRAAILAAHRPTVLLALAALADDDPDGWPRRQAVTARRMHEVEPGLSVDGWLTVLQAMARPDVATGACLLYPVALDPVDPTRTEYAAGMAGWEALRRLTAGQEVAA